MRTLTTRRSFLKIGAAGIFGLPAAKLLSAETPSSRPPRAMSMILLWLDGAPSTIDMWDPKPEAPETIRGDFASIPTTLPGIVLSDQLPRTAKILDRLTLVRSLYHSIPEHGPGSQYMLTGHLPSPAVLYPALGSVAARMSDAAGAIPPYFAFNNPSAAIAGGLGSACDPVHFSGRGDEVPKGISLGVKEDGQGFRRRVQLQRELDGHFDRLSTDQVASAIKRFQASAAHVLEDDSIRKSLDLKNEPARSGQNYNLRSDFGRNVLKARRLVEAGARFVTVGLGGWDTHANNFAQLRNLLLPQLDRAFSALVTDLGERGLLESTIVCCGGEFGRTPFVNGSAGRDHWSRAFSVLLAGGGFRRGMAYGATDDAGGEPIENACTPADLFATLLSALGIEPQTVVTTVGGRPMRLSASGTVMEDILG